MLKVTNKIGGNFHNQPINFCCCILLLGHDEVVQLLLDYGADVNMATQEGWSALGLM